MDRAAHVYPLILQSHIERSLQNTGRKLCIQYMARKTRDSVNDVTFHMIFSLEDHLRISAATVMPIRKLHAGKKKNVGKKEGLLNKCEKLQGVTIKLMRFK